MKKETVKKVILYIILFAVLFIAADMVFAEDAPEYVKMDYGELGELSMEKINEYTEAVKKNQALIDKKYKDVLVTVTFSEYLSMDEFKRLIEKYDLHIYQFQYRGLQPDGTRITGASILNDTYENVEKRLIASGESHGSIYLGITICYTTVDADKIEAFQAEETVYLVDLSGDALFRNEKVSVMSGIERNLLNLSKKDAPRNWPIHFTWNLEDEGIIDYKKYLKQQ